MFESPKELTTKAYYQILRELSGTEADTSHAADAPSIWNSGHAQGRSILTNWSGNWETEAFGDIPDTFISVVDTATPLPSIASGSHIAAKMPDSPPIVSMPPDTSGTSTDAAVTSTASVMSGTATVPIATAAAVTSVQPENAQPYSHVVVVMEENHDFSQVIGQNLGDPYINSLAAGGMLLTNYSAITHPSEPNYFAIYAGSTFGVTDDTFHAEPDPTLYTVLNTAGKTFTGYVEQSGSDQNHNPWEYFPENTSVEQDFSQFPTADLAGLPTVSFVIPGVNDDMHNGTIAQADAWLQANIDPYAQWATTNNSLLIVVWDENSGTPGNQVAAIFYGANVMVGTNGTAYNHYNMLATLLAAAGVDLSLAPNNASTAATIAFETSGLSCFVDGTRIATPRGDQAVEDLAAGDEIVLANGEARSIVWLDHRRIDPSRHSAPQKVWPVRISADAFGEALPCRDLWLSPDHAVFVDGMLIPVKYLINGTSIEQRPVNEITYYHIELNQHNVLLAEGLPVESYLDTGDRSNFANGGGPIALHPEFTIRMREAMGCAPLIVTGHELMAVRQWLEERARVISRKARKRRCGSHRSVKVLGSTQPEVKTPATRRVELRLPRRMRRHFR